MSESTSIFPRPSGWKGHKGDRYWTKDSTYGVRYKCQSCGRESLGIREGARMHQTTCQNYPHAEIAAKSAADAADKARIVEMLSGTDWASMDLWSLQRVESALPKKPEATHA